MFKRLCLLLCLSSSSAAQTLEIDPGIVTRTDSLKGRLSLLPPVSGRGHLTLTWSDTYGRIVAINSRDVTLEGKTLPFELSLQPALALQNFLQAELTIGSKSLKTDRTSFIVTPNDPWDDYQVIMYYPYKPEQQQGLRDLGVPALDIGVALRLHGFEILAPRGRLVLRAHQTVLDL